MNNNLSLYEKKRIRTLVMESNGLLTEGMLSDITNYIKRKLSPKKVEEVKQELTDNLGIDENSSKEEIEEVLKEKTGGGKNMPLLKKILKHTLGFAAFSVVWDITSYIMAGAVVASDYNPIVIVASVIFLIFSNTEKYEKMRRNVLGPKVDKFIFGKRTHLGDYDDENKETTNESKKQKKIIRLTEHDLVRLVKRIIKESK